MKLPPTEALILNQGMPPYIAKKVVYYQDKRFRDKAYSHQRIRRYARIGFIPIPFIKMDTELVTGFPLPPRGPNSNWNSPAFHRRNKSTKQ